MVGWPGMELRHSNFPSNFNFDAEIVNGIGFWYTRCSFIPEWYVLSWMSRPVYCEENGPISQISVARASIAMNGIVQDKRILSLMGVNFNYMSHVNTVLYLYDFSAQLSTYWVKRMSAIFSRKHISNCWGNLGLPWAEYGISSQWFCKCTAYTGR